MNSPSFDSRILLAALVTLFVFAGCVRIAIRSADDSGSGDRPAPLSASWLHFQPLAVLSDADELSRMIRRSSADSRPSRPA